MVVWSASPEINDAPYAGTGDATDVVVLAGAGDGAEAVDKTGGGCD